FTRLRDDWRMFKDIFDASGTEWNDEARSLSFPRPNARLLYTNTVLEQTELSITGSPLMNVWTSISTLMPTYLRRTRRRQKHIRKRRYLLPRRVG
ncbi:hypothetical protein E4U09_005473, partial [Claviceps aff. purpurea]